MKILIAGSSWHHPMYETSWKRSLEQAGCQVVSFSALPSSRNILSRLEQKYSLLGIYSREIQLNLLDLVLQVRPDVVLIWIGAGIHSKTIQAIKIHGKAIVVNYIHDDPFAHRFHGLSPSSHRMFFRQFIKALPHYDHVFFSKQINVAESHAFGCRSASVLPQYFVPEFHYRRPQDASDAVFKTDVAFAGHFEPDGRDVYINRLACAGISVNIYGDHSWKKAKLAENNSNLKLLPRADGSDYPLAISGAQICLCFMSKMNRDEYTTRCFEIPALGSLLLSERTTPLLSIYKEDEEAVFFSTGDELLQKVMYLIENPIILATIASKGNKRVMTSGHSISDRVAVFLKVVRDIINSVHR